MITEENLLNRIDELLKLQWKGYYDLLGEVYTGTIGIASQIWGLNSSQVDAIKQLREDMQGSNWATDAKADNIIQGGHRGRW